MIESDDLVVNNLCFKQSGFPADFVTIWAVEDSGMLISKFDLFHLLKTYDRGFARMKSRTLFYRLFTRSKSATFRTIPKETLSAIEQVKLNN